MCRFSVPWWPRLHLPPHDNNPHQSSISNNQPKFSPSLNSQSFILPFSFTSLHFRSSAFHHTPHCPHQYVTINPQPSTEAIHPHHSITLPVSSCYYVSTGEVHLGCPTHSSTSHPYKASSSTSHIPPHTLSSIWMIPSLRKIFMFPRTRQMVAIKAPYSVVYSSRYYNATTHGNTAATYITCHLQPLPVTEVFETF